MLAVYRLYVVCVYGCLVGTLHACLCCMLLICLRMLVKHDGAEIGPQWNWSGRWQTGVLQSNMPVAGLRCFWFKLGMTALRLPAPTPCEGARRLGFIRRGRAAPCPVAKPYASRPCRSMVRHWCRERLQQ